MDMRHSIALFFAYFLFMSAAHSQTFWEKTHIGLGLGSMNYSGDAYNPYTKFSMNVRGLYELSDQLYLKGTATIGSIGASEKDVPYLPTLTPPRPHPFKSDIQELSLTAEYDFFNINQGAKFTPYAFAGVGAYHYAPYYEKYNTITNQYDKVKYRLTNSTKKINIPFGAGVKYAITENVRLFAEGSMRYLGQDQLDALAPSSSKSDDIFYTISVGVTFRLGGDYRSSGSSKCPPVYNGRRR